MVYVKYNRIASDSVTVVVGTENLNLILDAEFMESAASFMRLGAATIKQALWNLQLSEKSELWRAD